MSRLKYILFSALLLLVSVNVNVQSVASFNNQYIEEALKYFNYSERKHRTALKSFIGVDPLKIEWCAAFVNAVLNKTGVAGSDSVSSHPLMAKSFMNWGSEVVTPKPGDIVIYPRGSEAHAGHVGFFVGYHIENGRMYYNILGGNQNNRVSLQRYPAGRELSIRRQGTEI